MAEKPNILIESIGVYLPPKAVSSSDILRACREKILYPLERMTGIKFRRMAGDVEFSIDLARQAITRCLAISKYAPEEIDLLVCCNISRYDGPDFHFSMEPSTSVRLKGLFGFRNAMCFDISNACAGMFTGIDIADAYLKAGLVNNVLVVSGEYITHLTKTAQQELTDAKDPRMACLTLGDSGAAMVLERAPSAEVGFHSIDMFTIGRYSDCCIAKPTDSKYGGAIMLTDSVRIHAVAIKESVLHLVHTVKEMRKQIRWHHKTFQHFIMHQTATRAIAETAQKINSFFRRDLLSSKVVIDNIGERGNTSTTSHILAAWDSILSGRINSGDDVLFAVQASGITIGTAPYTFDDLPDRIRSQATHSGGGAKALPAAAWATAGVVPKRVCIESVGVAPAEQALPHDSIELEKSAAENCFENSRLDRNEIDVLIHAGVHRNEFISEPAIAAMIAGELLVNDDVSPPAQRKTFAFDVMNGGIGFLNACHNGVAMIQSGKCRNVMVVTSEIENNADIYPDRLLGLKETGSAVILAGGVNGDGGFGGFIFRSFTEHVDAYQSHIGQEDGQAFLSFVRDPNLENMYLRCIPEVVHELLAREGLDLAGIDAIMPPQISSEFITQLGRRLNVPAERLVDLVDDDKDFYTSSLPYALRAARERQAVKPGDVGLIINVGVGIQVGCAVYHF